MPRTPKFHKKIPQSYVSIFQPSLAIGAELMIDMYIHEQKTSENEVSNDYEKITIGIMPVWKTAESLKMICNDFLVVKVNCWS